MSITRINQSEAKDGMTTDLHTFLISIVPLIEHSQGCTSCQVLQNQESLNELLIIETLYPRIKHLRRTFHLKKIGVVMPMLVKPPSGSYYVA